MGKARSLLLRSSEDHMVSMGLSSLEAAGLRDDAADVLSCW
eukprot:SAG22_NODE_3245_length_1834_cov_1.074352_1_plen_40_part_10